VRSRDRFTGVTRVNVVRGTPWKDALISVLEPRSPYRPWQPAAGFQAGEAVIAVLDTDPISVLAAVGIIGADGDAGRALAAIDPFYRSGLMELGTLNMLADFTVMPDSEGVYYRNSPDEITAVIGAYRRATSQDLIGRTSLAEGRILLKSGGRCTGCRQAIDLTGADARDRIHIRTVAGLQAPEFAGDSRRHLTEGWRPQATLSDWPAVLCDSCNDSMQAGGFSSFLDFKFSLHPPCPVCSAQLSMSTMYGMHPGPVEEPWIATMGCCVEPFKWCCGSCDYQW
jgi:hypothetical protein